jgi:hypothetical protein
MGKQGAKLRSVQSTSFHPPIFFQHVFKLEQEEYLREGIEWKMIDFYDNQVTMFIHPRHSGTIS